MSKSKGKNKGRKGQGQSAPAAAVTASMARANRADRPTDRKPRILVLEGLSGAGAAVRGAGGEVHSIAPTDAEKVAAALARGEFDGLLLTGGGDVNPRLYHRRPHARVYGVSEVRDAVETHALAVARDLGVPVFGICRGMQIQNVEAGGTMRQHVGGHSGTQHAVLPVPGSTFHAAAGERESVMVTSLHHQEVGKVARGYRITGRAPDGMVEAIESTDGRCIGVQFHPEMDQDDEYARDLVRWLVVEAARRGGLPIPPRPAYVPRSAYWSDYRTPARGSTRVTHASGAVSNTGPGKAGNLTVPARREWAGWCPHDGIRFDSSRDFLDHMRELHGEVIDQDDADLAAAERVAVRTAAADNATDDGGPAWISGDHLTADEWAAILDDGSAL